MLQMLTIPSEAARAPSAPEVVVEAAGPEPAEVQPEPAMVGVVPEVVVISDGEGPAAEVGMKCAILHIYFIFNLLVLIKSFRRLQ